MRPDQLEQVPQEAVDKVLQSLDTGERHHPVRLRLDPGLGWWVLCRCGTRSMHAQRAHEAWALWEAHRDAAAILAAL